MYGMTELALMPHLWIVPLVAGILVVIGAALLLIGWWIEWEGTMFAGGVVGGIGFIVAIVWLFLLIPYSSEYHVLWRAEGEITSVTNTLADGDGGLTRVPVVELDTVDMPIVVHDPRVLEMQGTEVQLTCSIEWVMYGMDRISCDIAGVER